MSQVQPIEETHAPVTGPLGPDPVEHTPAPGPGPVDPDPDDDVEKTDVPPVPGDPPADPVEKGEDEDEETPEPSTGSAPPLPDGASGAPEPQKTAPPTQFEVKKDVPEPQIVTISPTDPPTGPTDRLAEALSSLESDFRTFSARKTAQIDEIHARLVRISAGLTDLEDSLHRLREKLGEV